MPFLSQLSFLVLQTPPNEWTAFNSVLQELLTHGLTAFLTAGALWFFTRNKDAAGTRQSDATTRKTDTETIAMQQQRNIELFDKLTVIREQAAKSDDEKDLLIESFGQVQRQLKDCMEKSERCADCVEFINKLGGVFERVQKELSINPEANGLIDEVKELSLQIVQAGMVKENK